MPGETTNWEVGPWVMVVGVGPGRTMTGVGGVVVVGGCGCCSCSGVVTGLTLEKPLVAGFSTCAVAGTVRRPEGGGVGWSVKPGGAEFSTEGMAKVTVMSGGMVKLGNPEDSDSSTCAVGATGVPEDGGMANVVEALSST